MIEGGQELSSYPERCVLLAERRTLPGESDGDVERELAAILAEAGRGDPDFRADVRVPFARDAYELDAGRSVRRARPAVLPASRTSSACRSGPIPG